MKQYTFLFVTGSQHLYGEDALRKVRENAGVIAEALNHSTHIPCRVEFAGVVCNSEEILRVMQHANALPECAGVITWMHTFSPSKMWIAGLTALQKPLLHLNTQFNRDIPWDEIDMDYMNLHQSAHGDREHGFITARLRKPRKVVAGHWQSPEVERRIGLWMRAAVGVLEGRRLKTARFGDNMRSVAVTEGDKVEAQIRFGWTVDTYGVGDLAGELDQVSEADTESLLQSYREHYVFADQDNDAVAYQACEEIAIERFLSRGGFGALCTNFEDLQQLRQLPGLAVQDLMRKGYGFAAEGDWKTAALLRIMKQMSVGLPGGTTFAEDYTYHLEPGNEMVLGAHMLEICPTVAAETPRIEVHPLGIGNRLPPARLVFSSRAGEAVLVSLVDMGERFRMIAADVTCVEQTRSMQKLPVAGILWKPHPDFTTATEAWIRAGGAHHSVLSYALTAEHLYDYAEILDIEFVHISKETRLHDLAQELRYNDVIRRGR